LLPALCVALLGCELAPVSLVKPLQQDPDAPRKGQGNGGQQGKKKGQGGGNRRPYPLPMTMWAEGSLILGCPTATSVGLDVHPTHDITASIIYGPAGSSLSSHSAEQSMLAGSSVQLTLAGLKPNTAYDYRLRYKAEGASEFSESSTFHFQTQRPAGSEFTFFVQGDSHPERVGKMHDPALYEQTLLSAEKAKPDFFICLGDDFSVDTLPERTKSTVEGAYLKQVPYLGLVGRNAPVFLVNGNHEQAAKANLDGTADSLGVWAQTARNKNFMQPAPDSFYSGDTDEVEHIGLLRDYYAWTWGDALFVTIDPYWHSDVAVDNRADGGQKQRDFWKITLGDNQYSWLKKTLMSSKSKYKFVFSHHVLGTGRGGVERASYFEWGATGPEFKDNRPTWDMPIHQLFVKSGVNVFFQGHDHIFCKQELDGVIYQTCPVPSDTNNVIMNGDAYVNGDQRVGAGLVQVHVAPDKAHIEFRRSWLEGSAPEGHKHFEVDYQYDVRPKK